MNNIGKLRLSPELVGIGDPWNILLKEGATLVESGNNMR